jgi:hypothetical protein
MNRRCRAVGAATVVDAADVGEDDVLRSVAAACMAAERRKLRIPMDGDGLVQEAGLSAPGTPEWTVGMHTGGGRGRLP